MRKAFVGLSTPLFYDYNNKKNWKYPNPFLESPLGLVSMSDEIIFFDRSVCPKSMQKLPFIKYFTDKVDINDYLEKYHEQIYEEINKQNEMYRRIDKNSTFNFKNNLKNIGNLLREQIAPFGNWDDHGRSLQINPKLGMYITPRSYNSINVILDNIISHNENFTLINNSIINNYLNIELNSIAQIDLSQKIITSSIPNYLKENGPSTSLLYEIRDNDFIKKFRNKINNLTLENKNSINDEIIKQLNQEYKEITHKLALKSLDNKRIYYSSFSLSTALLSLLNPVLSFLNLGESMFGNVKNILEVWSDREDYGWAGFLLNLNKDNRLNKSL